jgi:hypothetical protein
MALALTDGRVLYISVFLTTLSPDRKKIFFLLADKPTMRTTNVAGTSFKDFSEILYEVQ